MASLYRCWKGSWDPYNHGIGPILKEASMIGGKPPPIHGDPEPNLPTNFRDSFRGFLESNFCHLYFKNSPYKAWRDWETGTECQLARPLWWIFPISVRAEMASHAKVKRSIFRVFQGKISSEEWFPCQGGCHESGFKLCHYSQVTEKALQCVGRWIVGMMTN